MRSLGLLDIIMVGIAAMIAGAIFILIGPAINLAGGAVIIAFALLLSSIYLLLNFTFDKRKDV